MCFLHGARGYVAFMVRYGYMSWGLRRKLLYITVGGGLLFVVVAWIGLQFFSHPATCSDGIQNGTETGVDCGGSCAALCANAVQKPIVLWARAFQTSSRTVTAAAYLRNTNTGTQAGAYGVRYAFRLYDADNLLIVERDGVIDIPPQNTVPVVEPNIVVGDRKVAHMFFDFSGDISWTKIPATALPALRLANQQLSPDGLQLSATVQNGGLYGVQNLTVAAVLFDANGEAVAASKSLMPSIPAGGAQAVSFTWTAASQPVRAEITPILPLPTRI